MARAPERPAATIQRVLAVRLARVARCIPRVLRQPDLRVLGQALPRAREVQADVQASAHVPAVPVALLVPADYCRPAKHHVRSVQAVRHAAVGVSSIRRPKKVR